MNEFLFIGYIKIIVVEKISLIPHIMPIIEELLPKLEKVTIKDFVDLISLIIEIGFSILSVPVSATLSPTHNECTVFKLSV